MADQAVPARRQADNQFSLSNTTAVSFGAAGGGGVILWVIGCVKAGHLVTPDDSVALFLAACCAPIVHAVGRVILFHLNKLGGAAAGD